MATLIGCQYYYLLFLLWFLSSVTFFLDTYAMFLRVKLLLLGSSLYSFGVNRQTSASLARCWHHFSPIFPLGLHADLPTAQMLALAFHS
ncbi:hypothetical protein DEO72_LG6g2192 [Vigna unguiculata]|uniref:Uncharacterized protein n=1 Tax=Vigna unguiculata TaxID=3917 RepID=A0A4D6M7Y9_VIGUN|nr:hypothetical protein DEO72_LG6g2192 [Vigna unguiculata]